MAAFGMFAFLGVITFFVVMLVSIFRKKPIKIWLIATAVSLVLLITIVILDSGKTPTGTPETLPKYTSPPPPTTPAAIVVTPIAVPYDDLFRSNELYVGTYVYYRGEIQQVLDAGGGNYQLRVNVTQGKYSWADTVYLYYRGPRYLEHDIISFVGQVEGLISYQAVLGNEVTIPKIKALQMSLLTKAGSR